MTQDSSGKPISDGKFSQDLKGIKAVILFPSLTTPCLLKQEGVMRVVVAVHTDHMDDPEKQVLPKFSKGQRLTASIARKFHSHMALVPWGNTILNECQNDEHYRSHFNDLARECYLIFYGHAQALGASEQGEDSDMWCAGWYLQELPEKDDLRISLFEGQGDKPASPFGVLHNAAVRMYYENGYRHLFQLNFQGIPHRPKGLYELSWLYFDHDTMVNLKDAHLYEAHLRCKPGDDLLTKILEEGLSERKVYNVKESYVEIETPVITPTIPQAGGKDLLQANVGTEPRPGICDNTPVHIKQYKLHSPGTIFLNSDGKPKPPYAFAEVSYTESSSFTRKTLSREEVAFMSQKNGPLLTARHPVYIAGSELLSVGVVSDIHISSRQTLYKFIAAQTIPGADETDSPFIGPLAHDNLQSARNLLRGVAKNEESAIVITGDIYDHARNCDPGVCLEHIKTTGDLWYYLNYDGHKYKSPRTYPRHIDGLMMVSLILEAYNQNKRPVFFVTGNHEAYEHPYGTSPRLLDKTSIKANGGIPADMNLTFYEATLLYGENYHCYHTPINFTSENMNWAYAVLTPWKDCVVPYGDKQNLILLGWGDDEDIRITGGPTLPRANKSCSGNQLALLNAVSNKTAQDSTNILFSHFPLVSYDESIPLIAPDGDQAGVGLLLAEGGPQIAMTECNSPVTAGTVGMNQGALLYFMTNKKIPYSISGHSHRPGVYHFSVDTGFEGLTLLTARGLGPGLLAQSSPDAGVALDLSHKPEMLPLAMVCGSSGPYGRQNLYGEFNGYGMEKPQGLVFDPGNKRVSFVNSGAPKPRLAVVLDYLWCVEKISPFLSWLQVGCFTYGQKPSWERDAPEASPAVQAKDQDTRYRWRMNPAFTDFFHGENPIREISLHAVHKLRGMHAKSDFTIAPFQSDKETPDLTPNLGERLNITLAHTFTFYASLRKKVQGEHDAINWLLFFSVKLQGGVDLAKKYDLASPWCFPVVDVEAGGMRGFRRPLDQGLSGSEVPNFKNLQRLDEYQLPK